MIGLIVMLLATVLPILFLTFILNPLGAIFYLLSIVVTPFGLIGLLFGFALLIVGPLIYRETGYGKVFTFVPLKTMALIMNRAAIVISEHNDIYLKGMQFDDLGVETIQYGNERKDFEDPDGAIHSWLGMTFALADEVTGTLFDPRHAALGKRKHELDERGEGRLHATEKEYEMTGIGEWVAGVFEMPTKPELLDLSNVRHIVDGGERSEYPKRTEEYYKHSRRVLSSGTPPVKFIYPIIGFVASFGGIWLVMDQLGGATSGTDSVTVSALFLALSLQRVPTGLLKKAALGLVGTVALLAPVAGLVVFLGPLQAAGTVFFVMLGYFALPLLSLITTPSRRVGGIFAKFLMVIGFLGYNRPVFYWTPEEYELREVEELPDEASVERWYSLAGSLVGFSHEPRPEVWDEDVMQAEKIENAQVPQDKSSDSNIPAWGVPLNFSYRGGRGPFGPKHVSPNGYYLHSGIALSRFEDSAMGQKSQRRLTQAKETHGEDGFGIDDKTILWATLFMMLIGIALGTWVFIL